MTWTLIKTEVWFSSVDISWTREIDGMHQRLFVCVSNDKLFAYASEWMVGYKIRSFKLDNLPRRYLMEQSEITALWQEVYFNGEDQ